MLLGSAVFHKMGDKMGLWQMLRLSGILWLEALPLFRRPGFAVNGSEAVVIDWQGLHGCVLHGNEVRDVCLCCMNFT